MGYLLISLGYNLFVSVGSDVRSCVHECRHLWRREVLAFPVLELQVVVSFLVWLLWESRR